jgi:hypothetical protein
MGMELGLGTMAAATSCEGFVKETVEVVEGFVEEDIRHIDTVLVVC